MIYGFFRSCIICYIENGQNRLLTGAAGRSGLLFFNGITSYSSCSSSKIPLTEIQRDLDARIEVTRDTRVTRDVIDIYIFLSSSCTSCKICYDNSMAKHESEKPAISLEDAVKQSQANAAEQERGGSVNTPDLTVIDTMDAESLRIIIRKVGGAIWGYACMGDTEKAEAARLRLYNAGMSTTDIQRMVPALDKWFDRTEGRATQRIEQKIEHSSKTQSNELTTQQLIEALRQADMAGLLPADTKLLANGELVIEAEYEEVTKDQ